MLQVDQVLRWRAKLRLGGHRSEYHRQFSWKKPEPAASPLLTAELVGLVCLFKHEINKIKPMISRWQHLVSNMNQIFRPELRT